MRRQCYLLLISVIFISDAAAQSYKNLAFEGGGIRGIAYVGAIKVLDENGIIQNVENVSGTSVGAIVAAMTACGYRAEEMESLLNSLKIEDFNDGKWIFIGGQNRMRKQFGWYRGNYIENWVGRLIEKKTGNSKLTFRQLHQLALIDHRYKDLYITATNLSKQQGEVFSWRSYPDMQIKVAVRTSISVPLYFTSVCLDSAGNRVSHRSGAGGNIFVDGGVIDNYPLNVFDSNGTVNMNTLGLKLERSAQLAAYQCGDSCIAPFQIKGLGDYCGALYNIVMEKLNHNMSYASEKSRTIYISTSDIGPRIRRMSKAKKEILYNNGKTAAREFLNRK
jgi:NTE family protein